MATRSSSASPPAISTSTGSSPTSTSRICPTGPFFRVVRSGRRPAPRSTRSRRADPTTRPGVERFWYRLRPIDRDDRPQDAHRLSAERREDAPPLRSLPGLRLAADAAAQLRGRRGVQSLRQLRPDPGALALPVPARRRAVLRHDVHPRPGVPRAGGRRRDRGPLLRELSRSRPRSLGDQSELPRRRRRGSSTFPPST